MNEPVPFVAGKPTVRTESNDQILWSPISEVHTLHFNGTSFRAVRAALVQAFGLFPIRLKGGNHLMVLRGMAAAAGDGGTPYNELIEALSRYTELELKLGE